MRGKPIRVRPKAARGLVRQRCPRPGCGVRFYVPTNGREAVCWNCGAEVFDRGPGYRPRIWWIRHYDVETAHE